MSKKFKKGFEQQTKKGRIRVSFLRLGTTKIVVKQGIEIKITAPKPTKESK